jgi:hypothetical protein
MLPALTDIANGSTKYKLFQSILRRSADGPLQGHAYAILSITMASSVCNSSWQSRF